MPETLGTYVERPVLAKNQIELELVIRAWQAASHAACYRSQFPVGSAVITEDEHGHQKTFSGCNVENRFFPATICAERNAVTTAIANGYRHLIKVAIACTKIPGGNSCGLCRQVLVQWGEDAIVLSAADADLNVHRFQVKDLLPPASGLVLEFSELERWERNLLERVLKRKHSSHAPYSNQASAAVFTAQNKSGRSRNFYGVTDDNASYGGSTSAEVAAMTAARANGYIHRACLVVNPSRSIKDPNPLDGESLQKLREFGPEADILMVNDDRQSVRTSLTELLPDSFGPESI